MITLNIATYLNLAFTLVLLGVEVWAFVNSLRFPADAYNAAFKRTKGFWMALTGGALVVGALSSFSATLGPWGLILSLAAFVVAGVFLADVLPALKSVMGRAQGHYGRR